MKPVPAFSLIIPTHRRALLLQRCVGSVRRQGLAAEVELVVVSDVLDPATDLVCGQCLGAEDIYVRRNGEPGPSASRNLGLQLARGRYVIFLDDDDTLADGYLPVLMARAEFQLGRATVSDCVVVTESRPDTGPVEWHRQVQASSSQLDEGVYIKNQVPFSCFAWPRHELAGLRFDEHMRAYEDWEFVLQTLARTVPLPLALCGPCIHVVKDETTDRRGSSEAASNLHAVMDYLYVYHRHPSPKPEVRERRQELMQLFGVALAASVY
jgi:GalNAc5-diNAcBac-PP-undecaprenol beta-1,3-glucosyltransferase